MADIIARLQVDSSQYDGKLKTAIDQMTKMEQEVRRTGATFAYADKEELAFIQSLGQMQTSSSSATGKLGELTKAFTDLSVMYKSMTEDERKSAFGTGLSESIEQIKARIGELKTSMSDAQFELKIDGGGLNTSIEQLGRLTEEVRSSGGSFENASNEQVDFIRSIGDLSAQSSSAKTKMMEYTNAITTLTTTYREMTDAEKNSDMGRALSESIDKLKVKAAELKDVMNDTNAEIKNMASDTQVFDQIAGSVGFMVSVFQVGQGALQMFGVKNEEAVQALAKLQGAMAVTNGLTQIQNALQKQSAVMIGVTTVQRKAAAVAAELEAAAQGKGIIATKGATAAQAAFNLIAKANPYVLLATAVIGVATALYMFSKRSNEAEQAEKKRQQEAEEAKRKEEDRAKKIADSAASMLVSYQKLRVEWSNLSSMQERNEWIKNNQTAFNNLGISVQNVADAEDAFVRNTANMIKSFQLRAEAAAYGSMANEAYGEYIKKKEELKGRAVQAGDFATGVTHYDSREGLLTPDRNGGYRYTEKGADQYNERLVRQSGILDIKKNADQYVSKQVELTQKANELANASTGSGRNRLPTPTPSPSTGGGNKPQVPIEPVIPKGSLAELEKQLSEAQKKFKYATTDKSRSEAAKEIDDISAAIDRMNGKLSEEPAEGSIAYMRKNISKLENDWENAADDDSRKQIRNEIDSMSAALDQMTGKTSAVNITFTEQGLSELGKQIKDKIGGLEFGSGDYLIAASNLVDFTSFENLLKVATENGLNTDDLALREQFEKIKIGVDVPDEAWEELVEQINEKREELDLPPIEIDVKTGGVEQLQKEVKGTIDHVEGAAQAFQALGNAMGQIEEPGAKVAGMVAEAIGSVVAGYGSATAQAATMGPWAWITFAITGLATMISTIEGIKSATAGSYAEGGIIPGNSYSGDKLTANVNSGELILNRAQQSNIAGQLQNSNPFGNLALSMDLKGEDIQICLDNNRMRRGR